ncbi:hypothetical protein ZIOFF_063431 [Zingiber officinale]|uniref:peptidylprolyl isomerase n=1 Tax=Zingiber officinale TaxID=94328 RepID=A0A8J5KG68_ZINOF|nr:hypothetical protein ZIOFF_063431 [Zingiber officinale]
MAGLAIGIASMRSGEQALLHVGWELGYGKEGSFSFPNVPPMADLIYEVELIGFDEAKEVGYHISFSCFTFLVYCTVMLSGKARSDMTVEERIAAAERRKVEGNDYFKEEKLEEAMQQYEMAIAYMGDDFMFQLFGKYRDMALAVKNPCHLNMAACLIKLKRYEEAIGQCTIINFSSVLQRLMLVYFQFAEAIHLCFHVLQLPSDKPGPAADCLYMLQVLSEDENNVKALFRRGKARSELGQIDAAKEDLEKARKHAPQDKAIVQELRLLAEHDKAIYQKQKEIYRGIFGPRAEPKPESSNRLVLFWRWLVALICSLLKFKRHKKE